MPNSAAKCGTTVSYRKGSGLLHGYTEKLSGADGGKTKQRKRLACVDNRIVGCCLGAASALIAPRRLNFEYFFVSQLTTGMYRRNIHWGIRCAHFFVLKLRSRRACPDRDPAGQRTSLNHLRRDITRDIRYRRHIVKGCFGLPSF